MKHKINKHGKRNKTVKSKFIIGMVITLFLVGLGFATTVISDQRISTPYIDIVNTSNVYFGSTDGNLNETDTNRPFTTNSDITLTVCGSGCNYSTIQDAVDQTPFLIRHAFIINVSSGTYNEDVIIPYSIVSRLQGSSNAAYLSSGASTGLRLQGICSDINAVKVKSLFVMGSTGTNNPYIRCMQVTGITPYLDENTSIGVNGAEHIQLGNLNITGSSNYAISIYASGANLDDIYFNGQVNGLMAKRMSNVRFGDSFNSGIFGSVIDYPVYLVAGAYVNIGLMNINYTKTTPVHCSEGAFAIQDMKLYCVDTLDRNLNNLTLDSDNGAAPFRINRFGVNNEYADLYVDDNGLTFTSVQDEIPNGRFTFNGGHSNSSVALFVINNNNSDLLFNIDGNGRTTIDQDNDDIGLYIDSEATTSSNSLGALKVNSGQGVAAALFQYGSSNNGFSQFALNPNNSLVASNRFYRNLASTSTDVPVVDMQQDHSTDDQPTLQLRNDGSGSPLKITTNTTASLCNNENEGGIYYSGSTKKHYGCNSTTWNALY